MRRIKPDAAEMPFLDHLEELRWRIIWSLAAAIVGVLVGYFLVQRFDVLARLEAPILPYLRGHRVMATHPTDGLQITISASMWIGVVLSAPVVLYQAWSFLAPALYARERRVLIGALAAGIALFIAGGVFAYVVVLPLSLPWLIGMFGTALEPMITAENYYGFVFSMVLSFGLAFELPVLVLMLTAAGLVTPQLLGKYRRHAIVIIVTAGALLSPGGDPMSALALAGPLYLLYELSVVIAYAIHRRRRSDETIAIVLAPLLILRARWVVRRPA